VTWRIAVEAADELAAERLGTLLEEIAGAVSAFETAPGGAWRLDAFAEARPDPAALAAVELLGAVTVEKLPDRDWLAENRASFPPIRAGRFFVHGSHLSAHPAGTIPLLIDATTAFGTGEHATTRGCLLALDRLASRRRRPRVLDMGTGTGILGIAAARLGARVVAVDIDPGSVRVVRANIRANGVAGRVHAARSDGYRDRTVRRFAPYDLVLANILARPLARMAPSLAASLAPGGRAVLSGLLTRQEPFVLSAHRAQRLALERRIAIGGWSTLVLRRE
jgi:ribosomal protein L11 methyltransferase